MSECPLPLVSVILPVRDRAVCVARAITSVLGQSYRNIELIVVDDGSSDGTRDIVRGFGDVVRLVCQDRLGAYAARNNGVVAARGELIAFIDSDDAWYDDKIARQVPLFNRPQVGLVFADLDHVTSPDDDAFSIGLTCFMTAPPPRQGTAAAFIYRNFIPTSAVVVRRAWLEHIGGFLEVPLSADYLAWVRIAQTCELAYVDACLGSYTVHAAGISYDLGRSLDARLALFEYEYAASVDPYIRSILAHILFNLSLSRVLGVTRRRISGHAGWPAVLVTLLRYGRTATPRWLIGYLGYQLRRGRWRASNAAYEIRSMAR